MSDKKIKSSISFHVRRDDRDHYPGDGLYASEIDTGTVRIARDYPGPTLIEAAKAAGIDLQPGDEVDVEIEVVSRVFTERRKP